VSSTIATSEVAVPLLASRPAMLALRAKVRLAASGLAPFQVKSGELNVLVPVTVVSTPTVVV
jgi:hypothetical protein